MLSYGECKLQTAAHDDTMMTSQSNEGIFDRKDTFYWLVTHVDACE